VNEIRIIAPSGAVGAGYDEASFWNAMEEDKPHFIGCDSGSTDPGPFPLGSGVSHWNRVLFKRDLTPMLQAARKYDVPLLIGSAGSAGGDLNLAWAREIVLEVAREEGLHFKLGVIHSEQNRDYLKKRFREGRIRPLNPAPEYNEDVIDRSTHIVGMMGVEPFQEALKAGAQVVLAGRASDTSIFSAIPVREGFPPGLVWHAAKVLECGGASAVHTTSAGLDGMTARITHDFFEVEPPNKAMRCSTTSVASHTLYENRSPSTLVEPSGILDTSQSVYEPAGERGVRVHGSRFTHASEYTIKLEGAELVGIQAFVVAGIRDPGILRQFDSWLAEVKERSVKRVSDVFKGAPPKHHVTFRVYGKNAVMGDLEPNPVIEGHEVCLIIEVIAPEEAQAVAILHATAHIALHHPVPQWSGLITAIAYPFAPSTTIKGPVYRFNANHVVVPDDPCEMFPMEFQEV
jgi:Acyclic terpene utilisation family protein AtuA